MQSLMIYGSCCRRSAYCSVERRNQQGGEGGKADLAMRSAFQRLCIGKWQQHLIPQAKVLKSLTTPVLFLFIGGVIALRLREAHKTP